MARHGLALLLKIIGLVVLIMGLFNYKITLLTGIIAAIVLWLIAVCLQKSCVCPVCKPIARKPVRKVKKKKTIKKKRKR